MFISDHYRPIAYIMMSNAENVMLDEIWLAWKRLSLLLSEFRVSSCKLRLTSLWKRSIFAMHCCKGHGVRRRYTLLLVFIYYYLFLTCCTTFLYISYTPISHREFYVNSHSLPRWCLAPQVSYIFLSTNLHIFCTMFSLVELSILMMVNVISQNQGMVQGSILAYNRFV